MTSHIGFEIAGWQVDPSTCQISQGEETVRLEPKVMDLLVYMAERSGEVLSRDELLDDVWRGTVVGYEALTNAVIKLRKAFGDDARNPQVIETFPKKGYRLVASVSQLELETPAVSSPAGVAKTKRQQSRFTFVAVIALVTGMILLAGVYWYWTDTTDETSLPLPDIPSIAILPFVNTGNELEHSYFSDGITDDLINDLSNISGLFVIARNSSFFYKGKAVDVREVAASLGVKYVLEGSLRRSGNKVRVNVQLIDGSNGLQQWSGRFDGELEDVFELQDQISSQIVAELALELTETELARLATSNRIDTAAYDELLKGLEQTRHFNRDSFALAEAHFQKALAIDPGYARAHAALAMIYWRAWQLKWHVNSGSRVGGWVRAKQELDAAMVEPTPLALSLRSSMFLYNRRYDQAVVEANRAIKLNPSSATGYLALAEAQAFDGQPVQAIKSADKALRRDPNFPAPYLKAKGRAQFDLKQYDRAIETLKQAVAANPEDRESSVVLLAAYGQTGQASLARDALAQLNQLLQQDNLPEFTQDWPKNRWPYRNKPDRERLIQGLEQAGVPEW